MPTSDRLSALCCCLRRRRRPSWLVHDASGTLPSSSDNDHVRIERDRLSLLLQVTNLLVTQRDLPTLLHALSNCVSQVVPHDYVSVVLYPDFAGDPSLLR